MAILLCSPGRITTAGSTITILRLLLLLLLLRLRLVLRLVLLLLLLATSTATTTTTITSTTLYFVLCMRLTNQPPAGIPNSAYLVLVHFHGINPAQSHPQAPTIANVSVAIDANAGYGSRHLTCQAHTAT